ncbi:hypothetical protein VB796_02725 [Arcicella sp. LKC2W]|uniref:hypothetical protein n=1 Tax=Arcicella sp. LKC2W TaxID=2984198 RepID=UPI002B1F7A8D|nr:hypothetical protein [Arcicella sp. LKC2W]MEA5457930.1 hypothetical protein [Arcicella sp. LKC2W]
METTQKPKRTYQKHKTEKKITVKHYVNTNIEVKNEIGDSIYPVYVQVTYKRKNTKFKSKIPYCVYDTPLSTVVFDNFDSYREYYDSAAESDFENALIRDLNLIKWLVNVHVEANPKNFDISELPKIYHQKSYELTHFVDWCLKQEIQNALCEVRRLNEDPNINILFKAYLSRIDLDSPALLNLEYFSIEHPELNDIKKKYSSEIWFFSIYIRLHNTSMFGVIDYSDGYEISFPPTIFDYLTKTFQKNFINSYSNNQSAKDIISDLDKLFSKYYYRYFDLLINPLKFH